MNYLHLFRGIQAVLLVISVATWLLVDLFAASLPIAKFCLNQQIDSDSWLLLVMGFLPYVGVVSLLLAIACPIRSDCRGKV
jgi:hypothetical protein